MNTCAENFIALATRSNVEELGIKALYDQYLPLFEKEENETIK